MVSGNNVVWHWEVDQLWHIGRVDRLGELGSGHSETIVLSAIRGEAWLKYSLQI